MQYLKYPTFGEYSGMKKWKAINTELNVLMNSTATKEDFKNMLKYTYGLVENDSCPKCHESWTPIKKEWPSKPGTYLVTYREWSNGDYLPKYDDTYVRILRYSEAIFRLPKSLDEKAEADTNREVIAWMELPDIYTEEITGNTTSPYSQKDYEAAQERGLDLDDWNDYQKFYELGEQEEYE